MSDGVREIHGTTILVCGVVGATIASDRDVVDLIGEALGAGASLVAVPVERLGDEFFQLRTRFAGEMTQKLVNYRLRLAIVGDITRHLEASSALRDFVYECNRGSQNWFLPNTEALEERLEKAARDDA